MAASRSPGSRRAWSTCPPGCAFHPRCLLSHGDSAAAQEDPASRSVRRRRPGTGARATSPRRCSAASPSSPAWRPRERGGAREATAGATAASAPRGRGPREALPGPDGVLRAHGRARPRGRRRDLSIQRARDARARGRVGVREDDPLAHAVGCSSRRRARSSSTAATSESAGGAQMREIRRRHADRLPGPVRVAQPAHDRARHRRRAARRSTVARAAPGKTRVDELLHMVGLNAGAREPLPARVLGRSAPAHRHRAGARARTRAHRARRARLCARRVDPGAGAQPARAAAERLRLTYMFIAHDLSVVRHISDRVAVMYLGKIVEIGPAARHLRRARRTRTRRRCCRRCPRSRASAASASGSCWRATCRARSNPPSGCRFRTRCWKAQASAPRRSPSSIDRGQGHPVACHFAEVVKPLELAEERPPRPPRRPENA